MSQNHNQSNYSGQEPITSSGQSQQTQSELEANTCYRRKEQENACDQVTIGFGRAFGWLRKWRELPITERSKAKPKQMRNFFWHSIENRSNTLVS